MKNHKECLRKLTLSLSSRHLRQGVCLLTMLMLLASNAGVIPNAYAASGPSLPDSTLASNLSDTSGGKAAGDGSTGQLPGTETPAQDNIVAENVYEDQPIAPLVDQENVTESVYSANPDIIDMVIDYPDVPGEFLSVGKQVYRSEGVHLRRVIHMPRESMTPPLVKPSADMTGTVNDQIRELQQLIANSGAAGPSVAASVYGNSIDSPNAQAITSLSIGGEESDLDLFDSGLASSQDEDSVAESVYNNESGNEISYGVKIRLDFSAESFPTTQIRCAAGYR